MKAFRIVNYVLNIAKSYLRGRIAGIASGSISKFLPRRLLLIPDLYPPSFVKISLIAPQDVSAASLTGLCNDETYNSYLQKPVSSTNFRIPERVAYSVRDAIVRMPDGIVMHGEKIIRSSLPSDAFLDTAGFLLSWWKPRKREVVQDGFLLSMPFQKNYHLWLHYILPRLMLWELIEDRQHVEVLVSSDSPRYVRETLDLYASSVGRLLVKECGFVDLSVRHLWLAPALGHQDVPNPSAVGWLRTRFRRETSARRRLLISRRGAFERQLLNEREVAERLAPLGFELLDLGALSIDQQISAFAAAEWVVGPHGAGFANVAFCGSKAKLVELIGGSHLLPCFRYLAGMIGASYAALTCQTVGRHLTVPPHTLDLLVDHITASP